MEHIIYYLKTREYSDSLRENVDHTLVTLELGNGELIAYKMEFEKIGNEIVRIPFGGMNRFYLVPVGKCEVDNEDNVVYASVNIEGLFTHDIIKCLKRNPEIGGSITKGCFNLFIPNSIDGIIPVYISIDGKSFSGTINGTMSYRKLDRFLSSVNGHEEDAHYVMRDFLEHIS